MTNTGSTTASTIATSTSSTSKPTVDLPETRAPRVSDVTRTGEVLTRSGHRFTADLDAFKFVSPLLKAILQGSAHSDINDLAEIESKTPGPDTDALSLAGWVASYTVNHRTDFQDSEILTRCVRWYREDKFDLSDLCVLAERGYFSVANLIAAVWEDYYVKQRNYGSKPYEVFDAQFAEEFTREFGEVITTASGINTAKASEILDQVLQHDKTWGALVPLSAVPPPLPYENFSPTMTQIISSVAESIDSVTSDMIVGSVFSIAAAATAGTVWLTVKDGWTQPLNPHFLVLSESASGKSPALNKIKSALTNEENAIFNEDRLAISDRETEINITQRQLQEVERRMFKKKDDDGSAPPPKPGHSVSAAAALHSADAEELKKLTRKLDALKLRDLRHTTVYEDLTPAVFVRKLASSWTRSCSIISSETDLFEQASSRVTAGGNPMKNFLIAMSGESLILDRMHDNTSMRLDKTSSVINVMTQPGPFDRYVRSNPDAHEKGLIPRFSIVYPQRSPRTYDEKPVPPAVQTSWETAIIRLRRAAYKHVTDAVHAEHEKTKGTDEASPDEYVEPRYMTLTPEVRKRWNSWRKKFLSQAEKGKEFYPIAAWMDKSQTKPLLFAAVATLIENPTATEISIVYLDAAFELADALKHHALYVMSNRDDVYSLEAFSEILSLYRDSERTTPVTKRELHIKLKSRHWMKTSSSKIPPSKILDDVLSELEQSGYIKVIKDPKPGRGAKKEFIYVRPFELD